MFSKEICIPHIEKQKVLFVTLDLDPKSDNFFCRLF